MKMFSGIFKPKSEVEKLGKEAMSAEDFFEKSLKGQRDTYVRNMEKQLADPECKLSEEQKAIAAAAIKMFWDDFNSVGALGVENYSSQFYGEETREGKRPDQPSL